MPLITEASATIQAQTPKAVSKEMEVFYNPIMKKNRDFTILLLLALEREKLRLCDPMAGSGIRAIRMLKELPATMITELCVNDLKTDFAETFAKNCALSKLEVGEHIHISTGEANQILLGSKGYDYLDIDPFGSPNQFLDTSIKRTHRKGILAVTATDTAPLCGTYKKACARKYWAKPNRNHAMHEWGLRILIRKCQLVGAQYDKAITPIFSYSIDHYFRIFFEVHVGKKKVDEILAQHQEIDGFGPFYTGKLWNEELLRKMIEKNPFSEHEKLLNTLTEEAKIDAVGFHDVHEIARTLKLKGPPKHDEVIKKLQQAGYQATRTHFSDTGIKTDANEETLKNIMQSI